MALFEVIKKEKDDDNIIWKYPKTDFNTNSQLIVHESQEALFYANGKALDLFGPGKYTLETNNIPLLKHIINIPTGGKSAFHCEIYFIDKSIKKSRWGTSSRIEFLEPRFKFPISIGACGEFRFQVDNSRKLLTKLVGIKTDFNKSNIDEFFNSYILLKVKTYIANIIKEKNICIFEIDNELDSISNEITNLLVKDFEDFGIKLENFFITTILKPEENKQYLEFKELYFKQSMDIAKAELRQKVDIIDEETKSKKKIIASEAEKTKRLNEGYTYQEERQFDTLDKMASNDAVGQFTNVGVGLGMISGIGSEVGNKVSKQVSGVLANVNTVKICPICHTENSSDTNFCIKCGNKLESVKVCPSCNRKLPDDAIFCPYCGERLGK